MREKLKEIYGCVFDDALIDEICEHGKEMNFDSDNVVMEIGDKISHFIIMLDGVIKVIRQDDQGNDLVIYFLEKGDTCSMTVKSFFGQTNSEVKGITENQTSMIALPINKMDEWMVKYHSFRAYIVEMYYTRYTELLKAIDNLAFLNLHDRLYNYLIDKVKVIGNDEVPNTHQEIALEMHTSRVVVSRLLKQLQNEGKIYLNRNRIKVLEF